MRKTDLDQKVNWIELKYLFRGPKKVPTFIHTTFSVMILGVVINDRDVIPPHFFPQVLRVNAAEYKEALNCVLKPWISLHLPTRLWRLLSPKRPKNRWVTISMITSPPAKCFLLALQTGICWTTTFNRLLKKAKTKIY